jgi:hypothetical protein
VIALQQRAALFDEIWHFMGECFNHLGALSTRKPLSPPRIVAGDTSTDMTWYTKRATLGAVYSTTELFMITGECAAVLCVPLCIQARWLTRPPVSP